MAFKTYGELQNAIARWLKRTNLTDSIPDFITLAEASFNRNPRLESRHSRLSAIVVPKTPYVSLPSDYRRMMRVEYGQQKLDFIPEGMARRTIQSTRQAPYAYPNAPDMLNGYTIIGSQLWLCTYIDSESALQFEYLANIEGLSDRNPSNWLLQDAPDIYLYGALMQAEPYLKNDQRLAVWSGMLDRAIQEFESRESSESFGKGPLEIKNA